MRRFVFVGLMVLTGCSRLGVAARVDPPVVAAYPNPLNCGSGDDNNSSHKGRSVQKDVINLDCFKFPEANGNVVTSDQKSTVVGRLISGKVNDPTIRDGEVSMTITEAKVSTDLPAYDLAVKDKNYRNRLTSILMSHADKVCEKDSASIVANEAAVNGILSILTTGLSGAGAIVTGERAKTVLSGTAAFLSGSRDHINAAVYRNQLTQAITAASAAERKRLRDAINAKRGEEVINFSVDDMIRLLNEYHQACSFYKGLELVLNTSTKYSAIAAFAERQQAIAELDRLEQKLRTAYDNKTKLISPTEAQTKAANDNIEFLLQEIGRKQIIAYGTPGSAPPSQNPTQSTQNPTPLTQNSTPSTGNQGK